MSCPCQPPNAARVEGSKLNDDPRNRFARYKVSARKRGHSWNLTRDQFMDLLSHPCTYCGDTEAIGVDRIDSDLGYFPENCTSCCGTCNLMKRTLSVKAFLTHIAKIASFSS